MPFISDADFAQFQQLKGGGAPGAQPAAAQPLKTWDPQKGWQGGPAAPAGTSDGLPPPVPQAYGQPDYTAQNAEIARRSRAAMYDPTSSAYVSPQQWAKQGTANAMQAKANPGWTWNEAAGGGGYWTPDDAHNNAAGTAAFASSWNALGKANPEAFDVPTDAQGRALDNRTGEAAQGAQTAAQRAQPPGAAQWNPPSDYQRADASPAAPTPYTPPAAGDNAEARQAYYDSTIKPYEAQRQAARQTATGAPGAAWRSPGGTY